MNSGSLYIVAAPSGAGKTTLVKCLVETTPGVVVSISHTTRPPRPGEQSGIHYHFVPVTTFKAMRAAGLFLENAEVFGNCYGTSYATLSAQLESGLDVVLEIDWQGARQVRDLIPESITVFILPPSRHALWQRLASRGQDSVEVIEHRMTAALSELSHYEEFDYLIVNDQFPAALEALRAIVIANRQRRKIQMERQRGLLQTLLS